MSTSTENQHDVEVAPSLISRVSAIGRNATDSLGLVAFLVLICVIFAILAPEFATVSNGFIILSSISIIGIVSVGQTLALITGGFDLSVSGVIPLGAVVMATCLNAGFNVISSIAVAGASGAAVGVINGLVITRIKINPLITTLGMLSIATGVAQLIAHGITVPFKASKLNLLGDQTIGNIANSVWVLLALVIVSGFFLKYTTFGRSLYAIGGNAEASWLAGIRVNRNLVVVYVASGVLAGLAGAILASQLLAATTNLGATAALTSITAVVIGGAVLSGGSGSIHGTILGVLIIGVFQNGLTVKHVDPFWQGIATGAVLLVAVAFSQIRHNRN